MDLAIKTFLDDRKQAWLKAKLKANQSQDELEQIEQEANEKYDVRNWLVDAAKRAGQLSLVSHPSKFSHPAAKTSMVISNARPDADGYLRSGQLEVASDVVGNAAALDVQKFLSLKLSDEQTVLKHLEQNTDYIKNEFAVANCSYEELAAGFLAVKKQDEKPVTHSRVKQVYFPVEDDYHLLSILTPSGLVFALKEKIQHMRFSDQTKAAREAKKQDQFHEQGYDDIFNLTTIGYGGTKPQNISVLNNQNAGKAYLLPCLPPTLEDNYLRLPRDDFFKTLRFVYYQESFQALHRLLMAEINNKNIREGIDNCFLYIVDQIMYQAWKIRAQEPGWSQHELHQNLSEAQKIWLDQALLDQREQEEQWQKPVREGMTNWIVKNYRERIAQALPLDDDYITHFKKLLKQHQEVLR